MDMTQLSRASHRQPRPGVALLGRFELAGARVHEACGTSRRRLALWVARQTCGPVLWIRPAWGEDRLHMAGVAGEIDPARLIFAEAKRADDILWCLEEGLRSGAVALAVAELSEPPQLTPIRRLQLAAETGTERGQTAPLGLVLTPGSGGARGVESRWQLSPRHRAGHSQWQLARLRARNGSEGAWDVQWGAKGPELAACAKPPQSAMAL